MQLNYAQIKDLAKQTGLRVTDLLALAPQNDPFYTGTPTDCAQAEWFAAIWRRAGYTSGVHLRRVHYWTVSQSPAVPMHTGQPYENTEKCWDYLVQASKVARYLGLVQISDIVDKKNPNPHINAWYSLSDPSCEIKLPNLNEPEIDILGIATEDAQPYHLEVWCEKSTMDDVLNPICGRFNANLTTFEGEVSITACHQLIQRIRQADGKPTRVWYVSDFDPAGNSMPVAMSRKVEFMLQRYGLDFDVRVKPLLLTADQVAQYKLPRIPIKETERRAAKFEQAFGTGAVELDALEALYPGRLANLLERELKAYYSQKSASEVYQRYQDLRQAVNDQIGPVTARYKEQIAAVRAMFDELREIHVDPTPYVVERYEPHVDEEDDWLFDSQREYTDQIIRYKRHKAGDEG